QRGQGRGLVQHLRAAELHHVVLAPHLCPSQRLSERLAFQVRNRGRGLGREKYLIPHVRHHHPDGEPLTHRGHATSTVASSGRVERKRSEEHTSELQSLRHLVCRLLLEKKKKTNK